MARQTSTLSQREQDDIAQSAGKIHSWHYWAVRRVGEYRRFLIAATAVWVAILYAAAACLNPDLPFSPGFNTVDRLTDPRLGRDYTSAGLTAIAVSGDQLAVGTERAGLVLLPVRGTFPRNLLADAPITDVAAGLDPNTFLVLQENQRLSKVDAADWLPGSVPLVEMPGQISWPGIAPFSPESVLLAKLDHRGLLLVVRKRGLARYVMSPTGRDRRRTWETEPSLAHAQVEHAVLAGDGLWLATEGGQTRFARLATLADVPYRARQTGRLSRLDAGRDGSWATAVGTGGQVWLYSSEAWAGPWFAAPRQADKLRRVTDVLRARRSHGVLWLATASHIFAYHESSRTMRWFLAGAAAAIESLPAGTLLATDAGLYLQPANHSDPAQVVQLESAAISELSTSPSGHTAVYKVHPEKGPASYRVSVHPFNASRALSAGSGWRAPDLVVGVASLGSQTVFGTSQGCLFYDPIVPSYKDCSKIVSTSGQNARNTGAFSSLEGSDGVVLAVAGGMPLVFQGSNSVWRPLDPENRSRLRQLTSAGGSIYGLGAAGSLYRFAAGGGSLSESLRGRAPSLTGDRSFLGDVSGNVDRWHLALSYGSSWAFYSSPGGVLEERSAPGQIQQIRLHDDQPLLLLADGAVVRRDAQTVYGKGWLPFAPGQATAVTQGRNDTVLVGGPSGQIARYSWRTASWDPLPPLPYAVTRLQEESQGIWARAGDVVYRWGGNGWQVRYGSTSWLVEKPGARLWVAGPAGVTLETRTPQGEASSTGYSTGSGIRQLLPKVKYAWQVDGDRVALFGSSFLGVFDRRSDRWEIPPSLVSRATVFLPASNFLVVQDGPVVRRFDPSLQSTDLLRVPDAGAVSIQVSDNRLHALYRDGAMVRLVVWKDVSKSASKSYSLYDPAILAVSIAADGRFWALRQGQLLQLQISDDALVAQGGRVAVPPDVTTFDSLGLTGSRYRFLMPQRTPDSQAALRYGPAQLEWSVGSAGAAVGWRGRLGLPVWCAESDRLSVQCVRDLAREGDTLLLATEFGVLHRSLSDYRLEGAEPGVWTQGFNHPGKGTSGPVNFSVQGNGLRTRGAGGSTQPWSQAQDGWRLQGDKATWIGRDPRGGLVLQTGSSSWAWTPDEGRRGAATAQSREVRSLVTPALRVRSSGGRITLEAFDHQSPFEKGRLFFDAPVSIRGHSGSLYSLISGRCVIQRDATNPDRITGAWPLPAPVSGTLERGARGVRFVSGSGVWELILEGAGARWVTARSDLIEAVTGLVTWRRGAGGRPGVEPFLGSTRLADWWSGDRFSWDLILAAGALDQARIVLVTPLGLLVRRLVADGSIPEALWLSTGLSSCIPARQGSRVLGMLIGGNLLVDTAPDGTPRKRVTTADLNLSPHLVLDWVDDPTTGRRIAFREEWRRHGAGQPLESQVPVLPSERLIQDGRFAFERIATAGRISSDHWAAAASCEPGSCLGALYENVGGSLYLRDLTRLPGPVDSIRGASNGPVSGRASDDPGSVFSLSIEGGSLLVNRVSATDAGDAFYEGDSVSLELPSFRWRAIPRHNTGGRALSVTPADFPLLKSYSGGVAFSFDILRSVASVPEWRKVALGTEGGVFLCDMLGPTLDLSAAGKCRFSYRTGGLRLEGVSRVRASRGQLWALYIDDRVALFDGRHWESASGIAPWQGVETVSGRLLAQPGGISLGDRTITRSNDTLGIGVRPLEGIVDIAYRPESRSAWLCSRDHGVFKLRLAHLR